MIVFLIAVLFIAAVLILNFGSSKYESFSAGFAVAFGIILGILIFANCMMYYGSITTKADLSVIKNKIAIQQKQCESVTVVLKEEVSKYLKHEEGTLTNLTPDKVQLLLVQYPQLASAPTVVKLMDQIKILNQGYYDLLNKEQDLMANILFYKSNVFYIGPANLP